MSKNNTLVTVNDGRIELEQAHLHESQFTPGFGAFGPQIVLGNPGTVQITSLALLVTGFVEVGLAKDNKKRKVLVPVTNFRSMVPAGQ